jgi:hypothetical protein
MFRTTLGIALSVVFSASALATDLALEPCIDGGVSASGNFPTQEMEEQIYAYRKWAAEMPGYLFAFSLESLNPTLEDVPAAGETN